MAIYAVGDLQGCLVPFEELLDTLNFKENKDQIWLTGDLVNRGPESLETLRLVKKLGDSAITVLGNHDLHLLALDAGVRKSRQDDTLLPILEAADREELINWLRHRPLLHYDRSLKTLMTHAGVYPRWSFKQLVERVGEVEEILRGKHHQIFLKKMYGNAPSHWREDLKKWQRARFITNALTRMRFCHKDGALDMDEKGSPDKRQEEIIPWFEFPKRKCQKWRIVFGHWSAVGFQNMGNVISLDSGCVWGGKLTAVRLDSNKLEVFSVKCPK